MPGIQLLVNTLINSNARRPTRPRTTIVDVARSLDITKGTVSRALNGYSDISDRTRRRVKRKARELGYIPLSHAQAIRTGNAKSLGLVLQVNEHDAHRPFLAGFLAGVTKSVTSSGWTLTVAAADSDREMLSTLARLVNERKVDGFILPRTWVVDPRIEFLKSEGVPFVLYGRSTEPDGCAWFDILGEQAMEEAVLRLHEFGHTRIAFVNGGSQYYYSQLRLQGYLSGLRKSGLEQDRSLIRENAVTVEQGAKTAADLLSLPHPPTAFLYATDAAALGLYRTAQQFNLGIGSDLSVISYDGIPESAYASPQLTTYSVDRNHAGWRLGHLLMARIHGAPLESLRETEHARLIERNSDGPPALACEEIAERVQRSVRHGSSGKEKIDD